MSNSNHPLSNNMVADSIVRLDSIGAEVHIGVHLDVGSYRTPNPTEAGPQDEPRAGSIVAGRYELVRVLGRGSMGTVWLANHRTLREEVALKLLAPTPDVEGFENASTTAARFRFEAQVAARLSRKTRHVVRVTDHGQDGPHAFLVMERLEGQTLERALLNRGPMAPIEVSWLVTQIARGLEVAHGEGVLHRDLKPSNIFLAEGEDDGPVVKLLDFGIARDRSEGPTTRFATARGLLFGTPGYMSPEQAAASPELDSRADLWSLAAIAYEALTGQLPVMGSETDQILANLRAGRIVPLRQRTPGLPAACGRFFERAFAAKLEDRYATCSALALAFDHAVHDADSPHETARAMPARTLRLARSAVDLASGRSRPRRRAKAAMAIAVASLALGAAWCAFAGSGHRSAVSPAQSSSTADPQGPAATERQTSMIAIPTSASLAAPEPMAAPASAPPPRVRVSRSNGDLGEFKAYF